MIKSPDTRVNLLRAQCKQYNFSPSRYIIRFLAEDQSWVYTSTDAEDLGTGGGGTKRKWDQFQEQETSSVRYLEPPPEENWICVGWLESTSAVPTYFDPEEQPIPDRPELVFAEYLEEAPHTGRKPVIFDFAFGDHSIAAVYERQATSQPQSGKQDLTGAVSLEVIQDLIDQNFLQLDYVARYLLHHFSSVQPSHGNSLLALGRIVDYYKHYLPHATVSMGVIKTPIRHWSWAQSLAKELELLSPLAEQQARAGKVPETIYPSPLSREYAFAAILQFESWGISIHVTKLAEVLAISSGNSLFIADQLLHDPMSPRDLSKGTVSNVIGNVGKPGVTLLISPPELEIREHDLERWRFINHNPFNGEPAGGMFDGTSLHMSFTGWEGPVSLESSNSRGMEAYYVETAISINDRGEWVGDLDILNGLRNLELEGPDSSELICEHDPSFAVAGLKMTSIDCWEEILDPPNGVLVLCSTPASHDRSEHWQ
jgi:hypothetical protein